MGPTMNCQQAAELLGAYALDAVEPDETDHVTRHIGECPRCASEVAAHRDTIGLLANMGGSAPAGLWDGIARRMTLGSPHAQPDHGVPIESPFLPRSRPSPPRLWVCSVYRP